MAPFIPGVLTWGKNLTDKHYVTGVIPTATFFIQRYWSAPRTFGLTVRLLN